MEFILVSSVIAGQGVLYYLHMQTVEVLMSGFSPPHTHIHLQCCKLLFRILTQIGVLRPKTKHIMLLQDVNKIF